ncbi:hypothetical protein JY435_05050 [Stenotrophomonas maltophilia]|uniref:hypothetical protein n=1 Tax=Alcaligenes xylosoxydans xylosoxydans TaxID=85698 RepID=UPI0006C8C9ED|nr:hypothetical protein [Achromobacter xylosoxidans]EKW1517649.1 hypothetical protein [Citrobacter freundii]MBN5041191.1 hypothetical protein [Stenotrophomonas maltophilia]
MLHRSDACLIETVMMLGAGCGKLTDAACHWSALPPSHSDDFSNASEFIGLDAASLRFTHDVLTMAS